MVAHSRIELLFQELKSCVLTDRRMGHLCYPLKASANINTFFQLRKRFGPQTEKYCFFCPLLCLYSIFYARKT